MPTPSITDELLSGRSPPPPPPAAARGSITDELLGGGQSISMPSSEQRPNPQRLPTDERQRVVDPSRGAPYGLIGRVSLLPDPEEQITAYANGMQLPRERFGVDSDGQIVYSDPRNGGATTRVVTPGFRNWLMTQPGPAIPMAAGTIGGMAGGGVGSVATAGAAAMAGDYGRQVLGRYLNDIPDPLTGPLTNPTNALNIVGQGAVNAGGQAVGNLITAAINRNPLGVGAYDRLAARTPANLAQWDVTRRMAADRGVDLDIAQVTGLPSLRATSRQLRRYPETTDALTGFYENQQTQQIPNAFRNDLNALGPQRTLEEVVGSNPQFPPRNAAGLPMPRPGMRGAAQDIIDDTTLARTNAASPGYREAFGSGTVPDISPLLANVDSLIASGRFPDGSATLRALQSARTSLTREVTDAQGNVTRAPLDNYEGLHNAKLAMDSALGELSRSGASRADLRVAERNMVDIQQQLTQTLRNAHPGYERGYQAYIAGSPAVEAVRRDIGALADATGVERMEILNSVFTAGRQNPQAINRMRQAFLLNGRIDEWNGGVRAWMNGRLEQAMAPLQAGEFPNVAGRLYATLSNPEQRRILQAALPQDAARNLDALIEVLGAARRIAPEGSPTATDMAASAATGAEGAGRTVRLVGRALSPSTALEAGNLVAETINAARTPQARIQLAGAFTDPNALRTLARLRMLPPTGEQAMRLATRFLTTYGAGEGVDAVMGGPAERAPTVTGPGQ